MDDPLTVVYARENYTQPLYVSYQMHERSSNASKP